MKADHFHIMDPPVKPEDDNLTGSYLNFRAGVGVNNKLRAES